MALDNIICRICLKKSTTLLPLFSEDLPHKIEMIASITISTEDQLPAKICDSCARNVHLLYDFRSIIIKSNLILQERLKEYESKQEEDFKLETDDDTLLYEDEQVENEPHNETEKAIEVIKVEDFVLPKTVYKCKQCDYTTSIYGMWRSHKKKHQKCPKAICNVCGKAVRCDNLKKHELIHTEAPVACNVCGKYVKNTESLRGHMLIHKNRNFQCNICGKIYKHRGGYGAHIKRHALGDVKTVGCSVCGKLFYEKQTLLKHMRSHTGERPYPCQYCKKGFSSSHALKTHIRRHTNEKPYGCQYCSMAFPQRVSLRTHIKSKHPNKPVVYPELNS